MKSSSPSRGPKGPGALVILTIATLAACFETTLPDHPLAGRSVRALGQEPGWHVDVAPDGQTRFVLDYGTDTVTVQTPRPTVTDGSGDARGLVYRADGPDGPLVLTLHDDPCVDSMSGRPYPYTARLQIGERDLRGCAESTEPPR